MMTARLTLLVLLAAPAVQAQDPDYRKIWEEALRAQRSIQSRLLANQALQRLRLNWDNQLHALNLRGLSQLDQLGQLGELGQLGQLGELAQLRLDNQFQHQNLAQLQVNAQGLAQNVANLQLENLFQHRIREPWFQWHGSSPWSGFTQEQIRKYQDKCPDLEVQLAALNALPSVDSTRVVPILKRLFARRDECSVPLRRRAMQFGLFRGELTEDEEDLVISVATTDPDHEVRRSAIHLLRNDPTEKAVQGIYKSFKTFDDPQLQQEALSALAGNSLPSARKLLKEIIQDPNSTEEVRMQALSSLTGGYGHFYADVYGRGMTTTVRYDRHGRPYTADAAKDSADLEARTKETGQYLREVFSTLPSEALKRQVISSLSQHGGSENATWLLEVAVDADEPIEIRRSALSAASRIPAKRPTSKDRRNVWNSRGVPTGPLAVSVEDLSKFYDKLDDRQMKSSVLDVLGSRTESAAITKLAAIARNDKDKHLRQRAIQYLAASKDSAAAKALADLIDQ